MGFPLMAQAKQCEALSRKSIGVSPWGHCLNCPVNELHIFLMRKVTYSLHEHVILFKDFIAFLIEYCKCTVVSFIFVNLVKNQFQGYTEICGQC